MWANGHCESSPSLLLGLEGRQELVEAQRAATVKVRFLEYSRESPQRALLLHQPKITRLVLIGSILRNVNEIQTSECTNGQISLSCERYSLLTLQVEICRRHCREKTLQSNAVEKVLSGRARAAARPTLARDQPIFPAPARSFVAKQR